MDYWKWWLKVNVMFSVSSTYTLLEKLMVLKERWNNIENKVFHYLWKGKVPLRVVAFPLKLLLDLIPTKSNLIIRNILSFYVIQKRNMLRIFSLFCHVTSRVWILLMFITPPNLFIHLECWSGEAVNEKIHQGFWLIWQETIWVI